MSRDYHSTVDELYAKRTAYEEEPGTRHPRVAHELVDGSPLHPGSVVLDVATGTGLVARYVGERLQSSAGNVLGIDISEPMLRQAKSHLRNSGLPNVRLERADASIFRVEDRTLDAIFCCEAIVLFEDPVHALQSWQGWLKRDGFVAFPNTCIGALELKSAYGRRFAKPV